MFGSPRVRMATVVSLLATLTLLVVGPGVLAGPPVGGPSSTSPVWAAASPAPGAFSAQVTWNGRDVASANSAESAVQADYASAVPVVFLWSAVGAPPSVSTARIQLMFFGSALTTTDSVEQTPVASPTGAINVTWQAGSLHWLVAGSYLITASLLSGGNGSTIWSESFYLHLSAPYTVAAIVPALMILLGLLLLYEAAVSGRYASPPSSPSLPTPESQAAADGAPPTDLPDQQAGPP